MIAALLVPFKSPEPSQQERRGERARMRGQLGLTVKLLKHSFLWFHENGHRHQRQIRTGQNFINHPWNVETNYLRCTLSSQFEPPFNTKGTTRGDQRVLALHFRSPHVIQPDFEVIVFCVVYGYGYQQFILNQESAGKSKFCVLVCLFPIYVKTPFVLVLGKHSENNRKAVDDMTWHSPDLAFPPLLVLANNHNTSTFHAHIEMHGQQKVTFPLFPTCKHTHNNPVLCCDEHLLSDILAIYPDISFLHATPHTMGLLSVPAIDNLCSDSCTATAVKTSFPWCQRVMTLKMQ